MELKALDKMIPQYAANKKEADSYKKLCDTENAAIKAVMQEYALQHYEAGGYKATYSIQRRESMNEELLLEIAHNYGIPEIVKTKEYIDYDALENAIYNNLIPPKVLEEMDRAKEVKEVAVLKVTKIKEKEE